MQMQIVHPGPDLIVLRDETGATRSIPLNRAGRRRLARGCTPPEVSTIGQAMKAGGRAVRVKSPLAYLHSAARRRALAAGRTLLAA